eukprot:s8831_g2.t1
MSPVLNRECLTVAYALDELLRGRVASAADVLCQRLKSLESLSGGSHWSTCQKLEVVPEEGASLVGREEAKIANWESREESKTRWIASLPNGRFEPRTGAGKGAWYKGKESFRESQEEDKGKGKDKGKKRKQEMKRRAVERAPPLTWK